MTTPTELPLDDKPPRVALESKEALHVLATISGMEMAKDAVERVKLSLPGIKFAICAIDGAISETRISLFARMTLEAGRAKVDMSRWLVNGVSYEGNDVFIDFQSVDSIDKE